MLYNGNSDTFNDTKVNDFVTLSVIRVPKIAFVERKKKKRKIWVHTKGILDSALSLNAFCPWIL